MFSADGRSCSVSYNTTCAADSPRLTLIFSSDSLRDCGHSFCEPCLYEHLHSELSSLVANSPPRWSTPQQTESVPIEVTDDVVRNISLYWGRPPYTCPTCITRIRRVPSKLGALKKLSESWKDIFGAFGSPPRTSIGDVCVFFRFTTHRITL